MPYGFFSMVFMTFFSLYADRVTHLGSARRLCIRSVGNFCYEQTDASGNAPDYKLAIQGMVELLHIPKEAIPFSPPPFAETGAADQSQPPV